MSVASFHVSGVIAKPYGLKQSSESVNSHSLVKTQWWVFDPARLMALQSCWHGVLWTPSETQHTAFVLPAGRFQGL